MKKNKMNIVYLLLLILVSIGNVNAKGLLPIKPLEIKNQRHLDQINLGRKLFYEDKLSENQAFSCHTCHRLADGGDDNVQMSMGGRFSKRNSPTIFNVDGNFKQLWDGRADDLHIQIAGLGKPNKLFKFARGAKLISLDAEYQKMFSSAYGGEINEENIRDAIVKYEEYLQTPNSPFDKFLSGEESAISEEAKAGYEAFQKYACIGCHNGANVGGSMYQVFGIHADATLANINNTDFGRYNVTKKEFHKYMFKVPSLRWAIHTAPYLHDGSVKTIEEVVRVMSKMQVGNQVPQDDQENIIEFLKTLPGELPAGELEYAKKYGR